MELEAGATLQQQVPVLKDKEGEKVQAQFKDFIANYELTEDGADPVIVYTKAIEELVKLSQYTLYVDFRHIQDHRDSLARAIQDECYRYEPYLRAAVTKIAKAIKNLQSGIEEEDDSVNREYYISFFGLPHVEKIRDLKTMKIGQLCAVSGTVVRTSEVRPELVTGTFTCQQCNSVIKNVEQQFKYTEPSVCVNPVCQNRTNFELVVDQSKFVDWQKIRVQENSTEIPSGSMPRSLEVILRSDAVERSKPGDRSIITGTLIVIPDVAQLYKNNVQLSSRSTGARAREGFAGDGVTGLKSLGVRDLSYKLAFLACTIQQADARDGTVNIRDERDHEAMLEEFTMAERAQILKMKDNKDNYERMINSIAPTVYGHQDVKRGVLLMLFGGVHKKTLNDISLRGDINVCIVGDPSTAKSQFLKFVVDFLPRAVYASGKGSSAAGLTVSVVKDEDTKEFCIEAGALMLADNGICCIDEFDKMDVKDQVAIHEAMEQQTISIAKAGINATLNARTSILAAANPVGGRYDKSRTLRANVALSPAIMSRFDLFFVVLDECNDVADYNIARHIVGIHQHGAEDDVSNKYSIEEMQRYIKFARSIKPTIPEKSQKLMAKYYRELRQNDTNGGQRQSYRITVRQLESMIRLSEALARLHLDNEVQTRYVDEAYRLLKLSIIRVETEDIKLDDDVMPDGPSDAPANDDDAHAARTPSAAPSQSEKPAPVLKQTITFEKYASVAKMLVSELRRREDRSEPSMTREEVIDWYLNENADAIEDQDQLAAEKELVTKIINRLITKDHILLEIVNLNEDDLGDDNEQENQGRKELTVHPNYVEE